MINGDGKRLGLWVDGIEAMIIDRLHSGDEKQPGFYFLFIVMEIRLYR